MQDLVDEKLPGRLGLDLDSVLAKMVVRSFSASQLIPLLMAATEVQSGSLQSLIMRRRPVGG